MSRLILLFLLVSQLTGCTSLGYYGQAIHGQMEILGKREPIDELLRNPKTSDKLRLKLQRVQKIRSFASEAMRLPDNNSFQSYADLERKYVVWNVFAAPEFSVQPITWCFPVAGCLSYRGYFRESAAEEFAQELQLQGNDVYVAGIPAYSTLGWFHDSVLNTVIDWPEPELAGLIFHELAHQLLYVKGDTSFNESFAAMVEMEGVRRWLENEATIKQKSADDQNTEYLSAKTRRREFVQLVMRYQKKLETLFSAARLDSMNPADKQVLRNKKQALLNAMKHEYQQLKTGWSGYSGYDEWMSSNLNNARIASVSMYQQHVPAFRALLKQHKGELMDFYDAARRIGAMEIERRNKVLRQLAGS